MGDFGAILIPWYQKNKRSLPWRETVDPYKIWLSEVILQQTRVDQGLAYYVRFLQRFPDINALANAPSDEVLKLWQGLGYYNRANNLMTAAKTIVTDYQGRFPKTQNELIKIKGIGKYTSAAIASMAFNVPVAVVDGNVFRVLSRIFGIHTPIDSTAGFKEYELLANQLMSDHPPSTFNQAIMEFGALFCTPKNPDCESCIFSSRCYAKNNNAIAKFPVKRGKTKITNRFLHYYIFESSGADPAIVIKKRTGNDIWKNLYDFPYIDAKTDSDPLEAWKENKLLISLFGSNYHIAHHSEVYSHQLTHRKIFATFIHVVVDKLDFLKQDNSLLLIQKKNIIDYPVPRLIEKYLEARDII